jgi:hypothetical protein
MCTLIFGFLGDLAEIRAFILKLCLITEFSSTVNKISIMCYEKYNYKFELILVGGGLNYDYVV